MEFLTAETYIAELVAELASVGAPPGPARLIGVAEPGTVGLDYVRQDLAAIADAVLAGTPAEQKLDYAVELALETTSYLYAAGAPHASWRHWSGLVALGYLLDGRYAAGLAYVVLGGEWECLAALRLRDPGPSSPPATGLWYLAAGGPAPAATSDPSRSDKAWSDLSAALSAGDQSRIDSDLTELAEFWMFESEGDWEFFHPRSAPDFDPEVCAAAAVVKHHGHPPSNIRADVRRFLEPGLADGYPAPLYPRLSPFDSQPPARE